MLDILLIEDDLDLAETVVEYLELDGIRCDHASNGVAGLELIRRHRYDVIALDLNLPRLDGLDVCARMRAGGDDTPVLMLTARDQLSDKLDGFRAGTDDYLVKPFDLEELVVRLRALSLRRSGQVQRLSYSGLSMDLRERKVDRDGRPIKLSPTGWTLLETLLRAAPGPVSRYALQAAVWDDSPPDSNALKVHLHHLRKAVDGAFDHPLIHTIPGYGFALKTENSDETADPA
jgi:DNA-binding response OmpR family regulator